MTRQDRTAACVKRLVAPLPDLVDYIRLSVSSVCITQSLDGRCFSARKQEHMYAGNVQYPEASMLSTIYAVGASSFAFPRHAPPIGRQVVLPSSCVSCADQTPNVSPPLRSFQSCGGTPKPCLLLFFPTAVEFGDVLRSRRVRHISETVSPVGKPCLPHPAASGASSRQ